MKLFRKKAPTTSRRQRLNDDGGRTAPTLSYYSRRSDQELNTGRQIQREARKPAVSTFKRFWVRRFGLVVLLLAILAAVVNSLTLSSDANVITLGDNGSSFLHTQATYQAAANKLLAGSIWNHNKITIDTAGVSRQLRAEFPELASVSVTLPLLAHRPLIYIQPAQPALILSSSAGSYVVDTNGNALLESNDTASLAQKLDLPVVTDQSGLKLALDHEALSSSTVSFIQTVVTQLAARHFSVSSMILPAAASELDVHLSGQPYFVKFNLQNADARQQTGTFLATQARLQSQNITPAKYIDVRVDGRAYYQ